MSEYNLYIQFFYQELLKETAIPDWKEIGRES